MPKINREEYDVLKELDDRWKWITRIEEGAMKTFISKPFKNMDFGKSGSWDIKGNEDHAIYTTYSDLFQFIQWGDEEPYSIAELIEECERSLIKSTPWTPNPLDFESEDIRVNDKKWLIKRVENYIPINDKTVGQVVDNILDIIHQLDEPKITELDALNRLAQNVQFSADEIANHLEKLSAHNGQVTYGNQEILSQKWIDEHRKSYTMEESVEISDLQNLLVPKQELPSIPKYVADWIAKHRDTFDLYPALKKLEDKPAAWKPWKRIYEWYRMNTHQFVNAYLTGEYEVEGEPLYCVEDGKHTLLCKWESSDGWKVISTVEATEDGLHTDTLVFELTEQEIKDFDPRYWAFRKPVEELEE